MYEKVKLACRPDAALDDVRSCSPLRSRSTAYTQLFRDGASSTSPLSVRVSHRVFCWIYFIYMAWSLLPKASRPVAFIGARSSHVSRGQSGPGASGAGSTGLSVQGRLGKGNSWKVVVGRTRVPRNADGGAASPASGGQGSGAFAGQDGAARASRPMVAGGGKAVRRGKQRRRLVVSVHDDEFGDASVLDSSTDQCFKIDVCSVSGVDGAPQSMPVVTTRVDGDGRAEFTFTQNVGIDDTNEGDYCVLLGEAEPSAVVEFPTSVRAVEGCDSQPEVEVVACTPPPASQSRSVPNSRPECGAGLARVGKVKTFSARPPAVVAKEKSQTPDECYDDVMVGEESDGSSDAKLDLRDDDDEEGVELLPYPGIPPAKQNGPNGRARGLIMRRVTSQRAGELREAAKIDKRTSAFGRDGNPVAERVCSVSHEIVGVRVHLTISKGSWRRLIKNRWLNDEILDGVIYLTSKAFPVHESGVYIAGCYFYTLLKSHIEQDMGEVEDAPVNLENADRWFRGLPFSKLKVLVVPVNVANDHWIIVIIRLVERKFEYVDSLAGAHGKFDPSMAVPRLKKWLVHFMGKHRGAAYAESLGIPEWEVEHTGTSYPEQRDGVSCGVFALLVCIATASGTRQVFGQHDIAAVRLCLADGLMRDKLITFL